MEVDTNVHQIMVSIAGLTFKPFLQRFLIWIDTLLYMVSLIVQWCIDNLPTFKLNKRVCIQRIGYALSIQ